MITEPFQMKQRRNRLDDVEVKFAVIATICVFLFILFIGFPVPSY